MTGTPKGPGLFTPLVSLQGRTSPHVRRKVTKLLAAESYDLLICDTIVMARHTMGLPTPATVLFQHNVEAQILRRHADIAPGRIKRWFMTRQWRKMLRFEKECGDHFDAVIAVSEQDKVLFERDYGWKHVHAIDTAVDEEFFFNSGTSEVPGRVMFLGSMDWMPNQDGVRWFVREVWPTILSRHPLASFHIVGRTPPAEIRGLAAVPGVTVVGNVPDVRPHLAEASVVVVPLLVGGGTRLKIYEAMAMNRAVDILLNACGRLFRENFEFRLSIIGEGPLRPKLEAMVDTLGLAGRVRFLGSVPHDQLPSWFQAVDLLVLPSHSEGVPTVLLEASACRTPWVASRVGGIPEIEHIGLSKLVTANSPAELAGAIRERLLTGVPENYRPETRTAHTAADEVLAFLDERLHAPRTSPT